MLRRLAFVWVCVLSCPALAGAQQAPDPAFEVKGLHGNRDYFSELPFEHIDTLSGNLVLTFTDVVLPGNAGMDVRVQRTYNSNSGWSIGLEGIPLSIRFPKAPLVGSPPEQFMPVIIGSDGSEHLTIPETQQGLANTVFVTSQFWRYDKASHSLELPNGWVATFSPGSTDFSVDAHIQELRDHFGNTLLFGWRTTAGSTQVLDSVTQDLGDHARVITFGYDSSTSLFPSTMTALGRTWSYGPAFSHGHASGRPRLAVR